MWTFRILLCGLQDTGANGASYEFTGAIRRDGSGSSVLVGAVTKSVLGEDVAGWDASVSASGNSLKIDVTGAAATNINWVAVIDASQVIVGA